MAGACAVFLLVIVLVCGLIVLPIFALVGVVSWWLVFGFFAGLVFLLVLIRVT